MTREARLLVLLAGVLALLAWSGWQPYDRLTWLMETLPVMIAAPLLVCTYRRLPLSSLLYVLIFLHAVILIVGGAYTYARVPIGNSLAEWFDLARNPYDRLGHLFQGFVPALVAREILARGDFVRGRRMLAFLCVCVALAIAASYELIEWLAALILGQGAEQFLGMQGDHWDTQWDMFCALVGALLGLATLARVQDRQIAALRAGRAGENSDR